MVGQLEQSFRSRRQTVFATNYQKSLRMQGLVKFPGEFQLEGIGKISVHQVTAEDEVISQHRWVPNEVMFNPGNVIPQILRDYERPGLIGTIPVA
jgi:hypothetical protein